MTEYQSLSHVKWECKYHIICCPKYRRKKLYGKIRRRLGEIIHELCRQKGIELIEGHAQSDHPFMFRDPVQMQRVQYYRFFERKECHTFTSGVQSGEKFQ